MNKNTDLATQINYIPWYLTIKSRLEKWWLKNIKKLDPTTERIVEFYTYNDELGKDFDFECPKYTFDLSDSSYNDFIKTCCTIGEYLQKHYGIVGRYYYKVKITLDYQKVEGDIKPEWKLLKTDNPRCALGNPRCKRDCNYVSNFNSKLVIEGYSLSGNYKQLDDILTDLSKKIVIMHSKYDSRAFLRIVKFLGVNTICIGDYFHYNSPVRYGVFSDNLYSYHLHRTNKTVSVHTRDNLVLTAPENILDINEFIVKRSLKSKLRDWRGK